MVTEVGVMWGHGPMNVGCSEARKGTETDFPSLEVSASRRNAALLKQFQTPAQ